MLAMHGFALALMLLPLTGSAGNAFVVAGMAIVAASLIVSRRVERPGPGAGHDPVRIPVGFAAASAREREASAIPA